MSAAEAASFDRISIATFAFSGLARVEGAERATKVDKPKSPGADGVRLRIKGREVAEPKIILTGWTDAHWDELREIAHIVHPIGRGERHNAVAVAHPALAFHGIAEVFVQKVVGPEWQDSGSFVMTLECIEWRPPPPRNASRRPTAAPSAPATPGIAFTSVERPPVASYATPAAPAASASTPAASVPASFTPPPSYSIAPRSG